MKEYNGTKIDTDKTHYVAWSGGGDSTLLLFNLCNALKESGNKPVALVSEPFYFTSKKKVSEAKAREAIRNEFLARGLEFDVITIKTDISDSPHLTGCDGLSQPGLWILQFMPLLKTDSIIHFGYINGDHFWYQDHNFRTMISSFASMLSKNIEPMFDLYIYDKPRVVEELQEHKLFSIIWFCELPEQVGEMCGGCHSCNTYKTAILSSHVKHINDAIKFEEIVHAFDSKNKQEQEEQKISEEKIESNEGGESKC